MLTGLPKLEQSLVQSVLCGCGHHSKLQHQNDPSQNSLWLEFINKANSYPLGISSRTAKNLYL